MKIAFNPSTVAALTTPPNNKDITFDLRGRNIFARGVKFYGTDTNTWRDIKINNVSIGSHTLDLRNGSNTTLTNTNGVVTINSTWRPVVDNLTSDSTTSSLSAKQGKVLKALIDGKSNSDHNHDDRYLRLTGGWMSGDINFGGDNKIYWGRNTDSASISFKNDGDGDANSYMSFVTSDNGNEYFRWSHRSGSTNTEWMALRSDGLRVRGTKVSLEGHSHNDLYYTKAESNAKYITDIATSVNKLTFTRNGSNIARNITVNIVYSQGNLTDISNKDNTTKASSGLYIYNSYNQVIGTNSYSSVLSINTGGTIQIAGNWGDDYARNLYWRSQSDRNVADYPWKSWRTILDSENYSSTLDSRYYTESEVNSLLDAKLNRQNLSYGTWNPRGWNLAADYNYNGGDLSISENNGKMYISVDGCFWQNEGQYRVLDTSDIGDIRDSVTLHQYLSATDAAWYPLVWGGASHNNTSDSTGPIYKSYDKLSWQTSSQTLYATNIQTNNIKSLSIGGGIYWNPYVESASDNTAAASITLIRSGVAGGTTLVLSQMNDTNDTIQFKTNTAARLYHNSYPILTTQNTYVSNNKGYINGTEITQVNNSDTLDNWHKDNIQWTGYITSSNSLSSYWFKMYQITVTEYQYNDITITFLVSEGYSKHFSIFHLKIRQNGTNHSGNYNLGVELRELVGNLRDKVVAYYNNSTGDVQLWGNPNGQYNTMNYTVLKKTTRIATDSSSLGILTAQSFSSVQTPPSTGYTRVTMARVGSVSYSDSTGSVHWNNVTNKPSTFNPAAHTHTVFKNNLMIKGTNGISDSASIHLGIGDSDTGFKWISDGVCQIYANNAAVGQWTSGGMNWFKNPTVNGNKVWNAGNDGSGSGLDADTLDGEHASSFVRAGHYESQDLNKLDTYSFIRSVNSNVSSTSPKGNTGWYNVIQLVHRNGASDGPSYIGQIALGMTTNTNDMFFRGKRTDPWKTVIHSGNIGNQTVANAYHLRINSANTWSTWYWTGQSGQPSWLWGSNDGTNMYVWDPSNFRVAYASSAGNADTVDGYHAASFVKMYTGKFGQHNEGTWTKILQFTIPSGQLNSTISFIWHPTECARDVWADFNINIRSGSPIFYVNWKGTTRRTVYCVGDGTTYSVWVQGTKSNWDPFGLVQVISTWAINTYQAGSLQYSDSEPTGTYKVVASMSGIIMYAGRLLTPRNIWGQSFNGTGNVSGSLSEVGNIHFKVDNSYDIGSDAAASRYIYTHWLGARSGQKLELGANNSGYGKGLCIDTNLNVGIGTNTPSYKLDVNGQMRASGFHHSSVNSDNYILLAGGGYKSFGGDYNTPIFLGYLNLYSGDDGTISSSFKCLGYSVPFTYTRGGSHCSIYIPDTSFQIFFIEAALAAVHYSGGESAWWLYCDTVSSNAVHVQGFRPGNKGRNPLYAGYDAVSHITVCLFGYVRFR